MPGNNKKGRLKQKELMNLKIASGNGSAHAPEVKDDTIPNLRDLNQTLLKGIKKLREEKVILTENLTRMNSQIEAEKKMNEELKEAERELRKELAKKEQEHEAAISKAVTQLQEAKHEIYVKENECTAMIFDKNKIEATVLQLKDQIQVISAESDARRKAWDLEKDKLRELSEELAKKDHEHEAAISKVRTRLQEAEQEIQVKENECTAAIFDKNKLEASILHLKDQIQVISTESDARRQAWELEKNDLLSQFLAARDKSKESQGELRKELAKKEQEHEAAISKVRNRLQEAEQEIQVKENECTAVIFEKNKLEASVLLLKDQIQVISAESVARGKAWELEKYELLSAARAETEAITKGSQIAEQAWIADKENLMSSLCRFDEKAEEMSKVLLQCREEKNEMESELTETKERTQELLQKLELDRHLWDAEKRNSEDTLAELQTKLELQSHINEDLSTEVLSLKDQLRIYNAKLVCMEEGSQLLKAMSASNAERSEAMGTQKETMENEIKRLRRQIQVNEAVNQHPYSLHAEGVRNIESWRRNSEDTLAELQTKLELMAREKKLQNHINEDLSAEVLSLKDQLRIYNAKLLCMEEGSQLQKAMSASDAERLEAMGTQRETMENEIKRLRRQIQVNEDVNQHPYSLQAEGVKKYRELEEKHRELLNEKEEQGKIIESLQQEIASLRREKSLISKNLDETTKMSQEISDKCLQNYHKVLELEGESLGLQTELAEAKSAYDEVTVALKNIKGVMNDE